MDFESTEHERMYRALRAIVGKGGSAVDDSGIEGLWRSVRAAAIARCASKGRLAALQAFPDQASELLPYYERLLLITADDGDAVEDRQTEAAERYTLQIASDLPSVEASLARIDARFSLVVTDPELSCSTVHGRAFEDFDRAEPFVPDDEAAFSLQRRSTEYPNYSSEFTFYALLELGDGAVPDDADRRAMLAARRLLADLMPAHEDLVMINHLGFTVGVSALDYTGLS